MIFGEVESFTSFAKVLACTLGDSWQKDFSSCFIDTRRKHGVCLIEKGTIASFEWRLGTLTATFVGVIWCLVSGNFRKQKGSEAAMGGEQGLYCLERGHVLKK